MSTTETPLLEVRHLKKYFPIKEGILQREVARVHAVDDVSISIAKGETLGLVGESGCGKSTLGRTIVRLLEATDGQILFEGEDITHLKSRGLRSLRREMQMVFQDPYASLNPRKRVGSIIGDPLKIHKIGTKSERKRRVQELLEIVGLSPEHYNRFPHEFSGGQRQRIGVARSLALKPKLIVADEPVSALDVSIQSQILNLLKDLQNEFDLTYLFIAHDLGVVRHVSDRIAVMYLGKMVELSPAEELYQRPIMPYTEALLSAVPIPDPDLAAARERIVLDRRRPIADQPAAGLPVPPPVPVHDRRLPRDRASADRLRRPPGRLPPPAERLQRRGAAGRRRGREPGLGPGRRHPDGACRQGFAPGLRGNPSFGVAPSKEGLEEGRYVVSDGRCRAQGDPEPLRGPHSSFRRAGLAAEERRCLGRGDPVQRSAPGARAGADDA